MTRTMHRRPLLDAIDRYALEFPEEAATADRFRSFVLEHARCFERGLALPGHVTGSAWIVAPEGDAVLLTHHRKLDLWIQLGGHADGDPDTVAVARREGLEESGLGSLLLLDPLVPEPMTGEGPVLPLDLDIHVIPERRGEPEHCHFDVRHAFMASDRSVAVSEESHDLAWVPLADLGDYTEDASVLRMADKWHHRASRGSDRVTAEVLHDSRRR
jgi:8-oxo-dGTP pyrophosphatase MutT (NUDIX family)